MAPHSFERHILFEGCFNFRDLGGYRTCDGRSVRRRRLFRSSQLASMTEGDMACFEELGIATIIDLREPLEVERYGVGPAIRPSIQYRNIPIRNGLPGRRARQSPTWAEHYLWWLRQPQVASGIAAVIEAIAESDACPAVVHCTAGKDRTGIVAAVILGVLDVVDEDIIADYAMTTHYIGWLRQREHARAKSNPRFAEAIQRRSPDFHESRPETMAEVLRVVRQEHGSLRSYIIAQGVEEQALSALEDALLC